MDDRWRTIRCGACLGHGVVSVYSAFDFEGPGECNACAGFGRVFIRPSGHMFMYPGGPALGSSGADYYKRATPYPPGREDRS